jgi:choline dehydrogenase-like flavoprotein
MATWSNWDGKADLILITSYDKNGGRALIIGMDPKSGKHIGTATIDSPHAGGIAVFEQLRLAYVSGPDAKDGRGTILTFDLPSLKKAIENYRATPIESDSHVEIIGQTKVDPSITSASFLTSHGPTSTLWVGDHLKDKHGTMRSYTVHESGELTLNDGTWEIPKKVQGALVTKELFVFSTSFDRNERSNVWVIRRGKGEHDLDDAQLYCMRAPSMSEGLTRYGDTVLLAFESGANFYAEDPADKPRNIIRNLHRVPLPALDGVTPKVQ